MNQYLLVLSCVVGYVTGMEKPLTPDHITWCWTSEGYGDYRECGASLSDGDMTTTVDLSSTTDQPTWLMVTFESFVDLTGLGLVYSGDRDVQVTFGFSDGSMEQAPKAVERTGLGMSMLQTEAAFPRHLTRSVTLHLSHTTPFTVIARELLVYGHQHSNLRRVSDWEHSVSCRYKGRDCGIMVDGFVDDQYFVGVGSSALIYMNDTYDITHVTLLEALPEWGASVYDKMSVTLGYPTGIYMKDETYEFSLCPHDWQGTGPQWQQITLPKPTKARYVNITAVGEDEKLVNGFTEVELFATKGEVVYTPANLPCMHMKEVLPGECSCDCPVPQCDCETSYTSSPGPPSHVNHVDTIVPPDSPPDKVKEPVVSEVTDGKGMSRESMFLFALCGTAGIAVGCMIGWVVTCVLLCRERRAYSDQSSQVSGDSQKKLTRNWEDPMSNNQPPSSNSSVRKMKEIEFADQIYNHINVDSADA